MSRQSTITPDGRWYKGNTHAHTNLSDGALTPGELVDRYKAMGYDFTAITDHRTYGIHQDLSDADFLVLPGVELDCGAAAGAGFCHHVVGLGLPGANDLVHGQKIIYPDNTTVEALIELLTRHGNLCLYAHPAWSHVRHEVLDTVEGFVGLEVYNNVCEVCCACGFSESYYDRLLWQGRRIWCLASDDTHQHMRDYGGGFIMVKAAELTHQSIVQALLAGSFYASQGPLIEDFHVEDNQAYLQCSPCRSIGFQNDNNPGDALIDDAAGLTSGTCQLTGREHYIRAICTDAAGKRAWTQPVWLS